MPLRRLPRRSDHNVPSGTVRSRETMGRAIWRMNPNLAHTGSSDGSENRWMRSQSGLARRNSRKSFAVKGRDGRTGSPLTKRRLAPSIPGDRVAVETAEAGTAAALIGAVACQPVEPRHQPADRDRALQPRQHGAQAHVNARAEGEVTVGLA